MSMISVALATYNGEKYIDEQIQSILSQTFADFEVIIQDDCSTDDTYEILEGYAKKDTRIRLYKSNENLGFAKNFEEIIKNCQSEYIAFADQDDIWVADHLRVLLDIIGSYDMACGNALLVDENGVSLGFTMQDVVGMKKQITTENAKWRLFYDNFVQGTASMVKKNLCERYLPVPSAVRYHDYWLALIAAVKGGIVYTPEIILKYRQHGNNVTNNIKTSFFREIYNCFSGFERKHSAHQVEVLSCLKEVFSDDESIDQALRFYKNHSSKDIDSVDKKYFDQHFKDMFLVDNKSLIYRKIYISF